MKLRRGLYNLWYGFVGQFVILSIGMFIPRFVLKSYGDEANGLIGAVSQIFIYLALIESGVGQASVNALYGPVIKNDRISINRILSAAQVHFRKLTVIYLLFVILIAFFYPLSISIENASSIKILNSTYLGLFAIVFFQGLSNIFGFYFIATYKQIMIADGRNYIISSISTFIRVTSTILRLLLINLGINLVYLQIIYVIISLFEVFLYKYMLKKTYPWVNTSIDPDFNALHQKNSFVVHEISNVIFSSTDILILSIFCDLKVASIYVLYNMVFSALSGMISQVHNSLSFMLGQVYNESFERYVRLHDLYDSFYISIVFSLITVAYILINPFISLYTSGLTGQNYVDSHLPILFSTIHLLSCSRITNSNLVKIAGHAKLTINRTVLESLINLGMSLLLVRFIGIYGVLLGTISALFYRTNDFIIYANKKILKRNPMASYKIVLLNSLLFLIFVILNSQVNVYLFDYSSFFLWGFLLTIVSLTTFLSVTLFFNLRYLKSVRDYFGIS